MGRDMTERLRYLKKVNFKLRWFKKKTNKPASEEIR